MDTASTIITAYIVLVSFLGFYLAWKEWRWMRQNAEEHKRRIRELADEYMEERER